MSYDVWGEPPDDDWSEHASEAGWLSDEDADTLRRLVREIDFPTPPRVSNRSDAALILIDYQLRTGDVDENEPTLVWAKHLLKDIF